MGLDWIGKWQDMEEDSTWQRFCTARLQICTMQHNSRAENGLQVGRGGTCPTCDSRHAALIPPCRPAPQS